jgi:hypothetical protein
MIGTFIFCETVCPSGDDIEKVVKMMLVPKLAASTTANGCGINYSINSTLYAISSKSYVKMQLGVSKTFLQYHNICQIN